MKKIKEKIKESTKKFINKMPYVRGLVNELAKYKTRYPPGHYYSPIISRPEIAEYEIKLFNSKPSNLDGIEFYENEQLSLLYKLAQQYLSISFKEEKQDNMRYYFDNQHFRHADSIFLNLMIRHIKPKRIIEAGSGFSSAVMLDTNDQYLDYRIQFTFIDPYPARLLSLLSETDKKNSQIIESKLQDIPLKTFDALEENDILFIDSTHVSKCGSDVNKIIFEILPRLKKGVIIHFHDVFYPFEYPKRWVMGWDGFGWNEDYILRSFLMYNNQFRVLFFPTYLEHFHNNWFEINMPLCLKDTGGSIYLVKL
jgi:predicted O-methyltransferase YrrM